jgi:hypothetical protein
MANLGITNWQVRIMGTNGFSLTNYTGASGMTCFDDLLPGTYVVVEGISKSSTWFATTPKIFTVLLQGVSKTVKFGNVCIGPNGLGGTPVFWRTKAASDLMNDAPNGSAPECALLSSLCLRNPSGADFNPAAFNKFKDWIDQPVSSNPNAAYLLSVQLACMKLNVESGRSSGIALVYAPGTTSANAAGFATVNAVMNEANALLCRKGSIPPGRFGSRLCDPVEYRAVQRKFEYKFCSTPSVPLLILSAPSVAVATYLMIGGGLKER